MVKVKNLPQEEREFIERTQLLLNITRKITQQIYPGQFTSETLNNNEFSHNKSPQIKDVIKVRSTGGLERNIKVFIKQNNILVNHYELGDLAMELAQNYEQFDKVMSQEGKYQDSPSKEWTIFESYESPVESELS